MSVSESTKKNAEKALLEATLCFLVRDGNVLLGRKTRHIGEGCWNGYGGEIEQGESVRKAAVRELEQESGVRAREEDLTEAAIITFHNRTEDGRRFDCRVHVFTIDAWEGDAVPTAEMATPTWFDTNTLPFEEMMPADRYWLPHVLKRKVIIAEAWYGPRQKAMERPVLIHDFDQV